MGHPVGCIQRLMRDERGGEVLEYALIANLIIVAAIATITPVGGKILGAIRHFIPDVPRRQHGPRRIMAAPRGKPSFDPALASGEFLVCTLVHSKCLRACNGVQPYRRIPSWNVRHFECFFSSTP